MISYMSFVALMICLTVTRRPNKGKAFLSFFGLQFRELSASAQSTLYVCLYMVLEPDLKGVVGEQVCIPHERIIQASSDLLLTERLFNVTALIGGNYSLHKVL